MMAPDNSAQEVTIEVDETGSQGESPSQSTSVTETTVTATTFNLNLLWVKMLPGQLTCVESFLSLLAFISILSGRTTWIFALVAVFSLLWTLFLICLHLFQLYRMFDTVPWMLAELIGTGVFVFVWFIADMILLGQLSRANTGAAFMCGLFAFLCFCVSAYMGVTFYLEQVKKQGTPMPSVAVAAEKAAEKAERDAEDDDDSNSEDSLSEMPTVNPIPK